MGKKIKSVIVDDMDTCFITGAHGVERHHCYPGPNRKKSEKYGYVVPLTPKAHPNGVHYDKNLFPGIDLYLKQICQEHFEANHGNRQDFINEFGRNYL